MVAKECMEKASQLSPQPVEDDLYVRVQGVVDGAGVGGAFEEFAFGVVGGEGHVEIDFEFEDAAGGVLGHMFADLDLEAFHGDVFSLGDDAHDGGHAGAEGGGYEIGGGEGFAFAVVIEGGIRGELVSGREMSGGAAEAA
jgi:hypothetical protein